MNCCGLNVISATLLNQMDSGGSPPETPPVNVTPPSIAGNTTEGSTLTGTPGTYTGTAPITLTHQWMRNGVAIAGETGLTYNLALADSGDNITWDELATNVADPVGITTSSNTIAAGNYAPVNTVAPAVTGTPGPGNVLSCSTGTWTGTGIAYTYQWQKAGVNISGQTANTYTQGVDYGNGIKCNVTATNTAGNNTAASNTVAIPAPMDAVANLKYVDSHTKQLTTCSHDTILLRKSTGGTQTFPVVSGRLIMADVQAWQGAADAYVVTRINQANAADNFNCSDATKQKKLLFDGSGNAYIDGDYSSSLTTSLAAYLSNFNGSYVLSNSVDWQMLIVFEKITFGTDTYLFGDSSGYWAPVNGRSVDGDRLQVYDNTVTGHFINMTIGTGAYTRISIKSISGVITLRVDGVDIGNVTSDLNTTNILNVAQTAAGYSAPAGSLRYKYRGVAYIKGGTISNAAADLITQTL